MLKQKKKHKTVEVIELKGKGKIFNCKNVSEDILRKQKQKKKNASANPGYMVSVPDLGRFHMWRSNQPARQNY